MLAFQEVCMPTGVSLISRLPLNLQVKQIVLPGEAYLFLVTQRMVLFATANETLSSAMSIIRIHKDGYNLLQQ